MILTEELYWNYINALKQYLKDFTTKDGYIINYKKYPSLFLSLPDCQKFQHIYKHSKVRGLTFLLYRQKLQHHTVILKKETESITVLCKYYEQFTQIYKFFKNGSRRLKSIPQHSVAEKSLDNNS